MAGTEDDAQQQRSDDGAERSRTDVAEDSTRDGHRTRSGRMLDWVTARRPEPEQHERHEQPDDQDQRDPQVQTAEPTPPEHHDQPAQPDQGADTHESDPTPSVAPAPAAQDAHEPAADDAPQRRHRPRPSSSAPLVYDDDTDDDHTDSNHTDNTHTDHDVDVQSAAAPAPDAAEQPTAEQPAAATATKTEARPSQPKQAEKKKTDEGKKPNRFGPGLRRVRKYVIVVVVLAALVLLLRQFVISPYYVPSASMEPTLHGCPGCNDDHVLVEKLSYDFHDPRRGDVVVFNRPSTWKVPDKTLVKRVIGVPGDRITIRNGRVFLNGAAVQENYVDKTCHFGTTRMPGDQSRTTAKFGPIAKGYVFVMGDNRCQSDDSRVFTPVPIDDVVGKAVLIIYPFGRFGSP